MNRRGRESRLASESGIPIRQAQDLREIPHSITLTTFSIPASRCSLLSSEADPPAHRVSLCFVQTMPGRFRNPKATG